MPHSKLVCVGMLAGAFGVRGDSRLQSYCETPEDIANYAPLHDATGEATFEIALVGRTKGCLLARVAGVDSREQVEALKGTRLYADRARFPATGEDEFYWSDLVGLAAMDGKGESLGRIAAVANHGAGDMLEIRRAEGSTEFVPFVKWRVPEIDLAEGRIVILPEEDAAGS